ncbi:MULTISPECIES: tetratricopeptide repeat protein [Cyanophyceae]|uniref:tetratricopeptide repeat protein n=1 Tax=Cyanophyceae TaxID=3028117 RepID=UPI001682F8E2|nr:MULTISPECIES: tetratricopeptide repeat protein [unclassified Phormidium]MBD1914464.1 tetratricopeptide repeat protein [Phormidium sp. FACHB-77]MBD2031037.1 tetratricopeptide repeat protein [Phormidium sp. FACHB-322]MBD2052130.1 tetratricopeptide repeat protein [Leptolyngbya sp. FACHB-60]
MTANRNRWLVGTVLTLALAAFLSLSLLPILGSNSGRRASSTPDANPAADPVAMQTELEAQAKGYELVLEREPDNQTALQGLVDARIQLGDINGVVAPLEKLVDLNPNVPDYAVLLAQTKQQMGDLEGAAQIYRQVLDQEPGNMNALQGLTVLLVQQERPQAAIGLLQDTLKTADQMQSEGGAASFDATSVKLLLAQVHVENNSPDQAIALYDETIAAAPEDFRPVLAKALVLQEQGDTETAQALFTQATTLAPAQFKDQIGQMATQGQTAPEASGSTVEPAPAAPAPTESTP